MDDYQVNDAFCESNEYCCRMRGICGKDLARGKPDKSPIEYYDDEELDIFNGRSSDSYTPEEIRQFREILTTMYPSDVPGWLKSLELRGVKCPDSLIEN